MKFWDSSAIVALVLREEETTAMRALVSADPDLVTWALSGIEVTSALWRRTHAGELTQAARTSAARALIDLEASWNAIADVLSVVARARRVLAAHPLRAADACQLAAALVACHERTEELDFVTLDNRLAAAAQREGFRVLPAASPG